MKKLLNIITRYFYTMKKILTLITLVLVLLTLITGCNTNADKIDSGDENSDVDYNGDNSNSNDNSGSSSIPQPPALPSD
jgi:hypothetical protein